MKMKDEMKIRSTLVPEVANMIWVESELHQAQRDTVKQLGYKCTDFYYNETIPTGANIILVQGPYGPILPLVKQLQLYPKETRPVFIYWFQQNLNLSVPKPLRQFFGRLFSNLVYTFKQAGWLEIWLHKLFPNFFGVRGRYLANIGDILWLHKQGMLDVLGLSSKIYVRIFLDLGIQSTFVQRGYDPRYGKILDEDRDIALVWMGAIRNKRRRRFVYWLKDQLEKRGLTMLIFDGVNTPFIFGEKRTQILNRTWFVANIYEHLTYDLSVRFIHAGANGAVVITEPSPNQYPFVPGIHMVECPVKEMPNRIMYYISHPEEWEKISSANFKLISEELTLERTISTLMEAAIDKLALRSASQMI